MTPEQMNNVNEIFTARRRSVDDKAPWVTNNILKGEDHQVVTIATRPDKVGEVLSVLRINELLDTQCENDSSCSGRIHLENPVIRENNGMTYIDFTDRSAK